MKNFYNILSGLDTTLWYDNAGGRYGKSLDFFGNEIKYLPFEIVEKLQNPSALNVFGGEAFNMFQNHIPVDSVISSPPLVPTDLTWYLVSTVETLYDNVVELTLDANTETFIVDSLITAENGATGIVTDVNTLDITVKYNGTDFIDSGLNGVTLGDAYDSDNDDKVVAFATVASRTGDENGFSKNSNSLAYYDSSDSLNPWKFLRPLANMTIIMSTKIYTFDFVDNDDSRWKVV